MTPKTLFDDVIKQIEKNESKWAIRDWKIPS